MLIYNYLSRYIIQCVHCTLHNLFISIIYSSISFTYLSSYIYFSTYKYIYLNIYTSIYLAIHLFLYLYVYFLYEQLYILYLYSVHLFIYLYIYLSINPVHKTSNQLFPFILAENVTSKRNDFK